MLLGVAGVLFTASGCGPVEQTATESIPSADGTIVVTGRVVGERGEPVAGAQVVFEPDGDTLRARGLDSWTLRTEVGRFTVDAFPRVTTDPRGRFQLRCRVLRASSPLRERPSLSACSIYVIHPEHQLGGAAWTPEPGVARDLGAIELRAAASVSGRVVDRHGRPVAGAVVRAGVDGSDRHPLGVRLIWAYDPIEMLDWELREARTDEEGRFRVGHLEAGLGWVQIAGTGAATVLVREVMLTPGRTTDVGDVDLPAGRRVVGRVVDGAGASVVGAEVLAIDPHSGRPLDGPVNRLTVARWRRAARPSPTATDDDGRFAIGGVGEDPLSLLVVAPGFEPLGVADVSEWGVDDERTIVLHELRRLALRVVDGRTGAPVSGARIVRAAPSEASFWLPADGFGAGLAAVGEGSDASGELSLTGVGRDLEGLEITVAAEGYGTRTVDVGVPVDATSAPGTPVVPDGPPLHLDPESVLQGQVVDAAGAPLAGVVVTVEEREPENTWGVEPWRVRRAVTDAEGRFAVGALSAGSYFVDASTPAGDAVAEESWVPLEAGESRTDLRLSLSPAAVLRGRVRWADGTQAPPVSLILRGREVRRTYSDREGNFVFDRLPAGSWRLESLPYRHSSELELVAGERVRHDVELPTRPVRGRVLDADGPVPGAAVYRKRWAGATAGLDGRFEIAPDRGGEIHLRAVSLRGGTSEWLTVDPLANAGDDVVLVLGSSRLTVEVVDEETGAPVVDRFVSLFVQWPGRQSIGRRTDGFGRVAFEGLAAGSYGVDVYVEGGARALAGIDDAAPTEGGEAGPHGVTLVDGEEAVVRLAVARS